MPASAYSVSGTTIAAAPAQILINGTNVPEKISVLPCSNVLTARFAEPAEAVAFALRLDYKLPRVSWIRNEFELTDREGGELPRSVPVLVALYGPRNGNLRGPLVSRWQAQGNGKIPTRLLRPNEVYTVVIRDVCTADVLGSRSFTPEPLVSAASRD